MVCKCEGSVNVSSCCYYVTTPSRVLARVPPVSFMDGLTDRNRRRPRFSPVYLFIVCFGPSSMGRPFLIYGPSQLGLILILMSQSSGCSAGAMVSAMTFPALGRRSRISMCACSPFGLLCPPIYLKVRGGTSFPSLYICIRGGLSPDCTRLLPSFPMPLFTWGPTC